MTEAFDPITLEIHWSRLISIADEAATGLLRTAFSTIVREFERLRHRADGPQRRQLSARTPAASPSSPASCRRPRSTSCERFPAETWRPGDCVITNDPWLATGHLPDFTAVTPIFHRGSAGRLRGIDRAFARCRRRAVVGRLPGAVRGRHPHPARSPASATASGNRTLLDCPARQCPRAATRCWATWKRRSSPTRSARARRAGIPGRHRPAGPAGPRPPRCTPAPIAPCAAPSPRCRTAPGAATIEADGFDEAITRIACAVTIAGDTHAYRLRRHLARRSIAASTA